MNAARSRDQKSCRMPPRGDQLTYFFIVADYRSDRLRQPLRVFGARILTRRNAPHLQLGENIWMILNVGGGPTPDKPTVTPLTPTRITSAL